MSRPAAGSSTCSYGSWAVEKYIAEAKALGFDIVEVSSGFISLPTDDWLRLMDAVPKPGSRQSRSSGFNSVRAARRQPPNWQPKGPARCNW